MSHQKVPRKVCIETFQVDDYSFVDFMEFVDFATCLDVTPDEKRRIIDLFFQNLNRLDDSVKCNNEPGQERPDHIEGIGDLENILLVIRNKGNVIGCFLLVDIKVVSETEERITVTASPVPGLYDDVGFAGFSVPGTVVFLSAALDVFESVMNFELRLTNGKILDIIRLDMPVSWYDSYMELESLKQEEKTAPEDSTHRIANRTGANYVYGQNEQGKDRLFIQKIK